MLRTQTLYMLNGVTLGCFNNFYLWVSFKDCKVKGATFIKGILVDVILDNDRIKYMEEHWGEKLHIDRTTEDTLGGYIHGVLDEKVIR